MKVDRYNPHLVITGTSSNDFSNTLNKMAEYLLLMYTHPWLSLLYLSVLSYQYHLSTRKSPIAIPSIPVP